MDTWYEEDLIKCKIRTPQFDGKGNIKHIHEQEGAVEKGTWIFRPYSFSNGNHIVNFRTKEEFEKARVNE